MTNQAADISSMDRFALTGQVIVVTGASKGIGRELAMLLAATGAVVIPTVRSTTDADDLLAEAQQRGLSIHPQLLDVREVAAASAVVEKVADRHGRLDVLVNNAGLGHGHAALDVTEFDWDDMMSVNLRGMFFTSQAAAKVMIASGGGGRIINLSSQGGLVGLPNAAVYCTSKGGVNMMTKVLAIEWAKYDITVNAIAPTFISTPGTAPILNDPKARKEILARIPLNRIGNPEDVAGAVIYLAADTGRMLTGTILVVDGGWTSQ